MSIATSTAKIQYTLASGAQALPVPFYFLEDAHIKVIKSGSPDLVLTKGTDYTITGATDDDGGTVTTIAGTVADLQAGDIITIKRDIAITQTVNYVYNDRFPAETHERALDKLTMIVQQLKEVTDRSVQFPETEVAGTGNIMPAAADRAAKLFGFDASGNAVQLYDPVSGVFTNGDGIMLTTVAALKAVSVTDLTNGYMAQVAGYSAPGDGGGGLWAYVSASAATESVGVIVSPNVGTGRWLRVFTGPVSVKWWGAKGDGATDDTAAITAAFNYAKVLTGSAPSGDYGRLGTAHLHFPKGDYIFAGPALSTNTGMSIAITGDGHHHTRIQVGAGIYFLDTNGVLYRMKIQGIHFYGGKGAWKHSYAAINVQGHIDITENTFAAYTEAAIVSLAPDMPYIKVRHNLFYGASALTSKGVCFGGATDQCEISNNSFLRNLYHIKVANGGQNCKIRDNDLLRFTNGGGAPKLTDIWIVPLPATPTNAGVGLEVTGNKFGNENRSTTDYCVLVADEAAGTDFADKNHATTVSTGYIVGGIYSNNYVSAGSGAANGFIHSYTKYCYGYVIQNTYVGGYPDGIVKFDAAVTYANDNRIEDISYIGPSAVIDASETLQTAPTSRPGAAIVADPFAFYQGNPDTITHFQNGHASGFVNYGATELDTAALLLSNATKAAAVDALGGANASEVTFSSVAGLAYLNQPTTNVTVGRRAWIEIDLKRSAATPMTSVLINLRDAGAGNIAVKRFVNLTADWQTIRIPYVPRQTGSAMAIRIESPGYSAGVAEKVLIGRMRMYHAASPVNPGTIFKESKATFNPASLADGEGETTTVAVVGAALGDFAMASFSLDTQGITITAWVSAADTVSVRFQNESGGVLDIGSGTLRVRTLKPTY